MTSPAAELAEALERHTQALQANTAAVLSLEHQLRIGAEPIDVDQMRARLERQLQESAAITAQLEGLKRALSKIDPPLPPISVCGVIHPTLPLRCLLHVSHPGAHQWLDPNP